MKGSALAGWAAPGTLAIIAGPGEPVFPHAWRRATVLCMGLLATAASVEAVWLLDQPDTVLQTRIVADGGAAGRGALAAMAMRFATDPEHRVLLGDGGGTLLVTVQDRDAAIARERLQSMVDTILNMPAAAATPVAPRPAGSALVEERLRLQAASDALETRAADLSAALTAVTRDLAASLRNAADRRAGGSVSGKGAAVLADLQLQRFTLLTKYQSDFPAIVALEGQIRDLKAFLADSAHRADSHLPGPEPADAVLLAERDRLRSELASLDTRRGTLGAELASLDNRPADVPPAALANPALAVPILVEAATMSGLGPDTRPGAMAAVSLAGLLLSLLSLRAGRRRAAAMPHLRSLMLDREEAAALPAGSELMIVQLPSEAALRYNRS